MRVTRFSFAQIGLASLLSVLMLCFLITPTGAFAQSQASTGQVAGSVKDAAGAIVPGASVTLTNTANGFVQKVTTNDEGSFRAVLLPAGKYTISIEKQGFSATTAEVEVGVGRTAELNATLTVGGRKEQVTVTAESIEVSRHEAAAFVGAQVVANIPLNGARFTDIVKTTPGADTDPSRGGIQMTGQRMVNTGSIHVDGADYGQLFFGGIKGGERANFAPTIPLDSIQEFQIVRSGYTAEFGRSTGGVMTAITKSGTNAIHGSGTYRIRPDVMAMSNEYYDATATDLISKGCTTCVVNPNPTLHQWAGTVGGPIKKDKLFFFGSYEQQRQRIPHQVYFQNIHGSFTPSAPTQEAYDYYKSLETPFTQTNDAYLFLTKLDYQISDKHRMNVRYNHSQYTGINANSVGTNLSPTVTAALSNNGTEIDRTRTVVGSLNSYFTKFANEFRGQYTFEKRPRLANAQSPTVSNSGAGNYGTVSFLGQNEEHDYRVQLVDNVTRISGNHTWKFGGEYNHIFATQLFGFNQHGNFGNSVSNNPGSWLTTLGNRFNDTTSRYTHQLGNLQATMAGDQFAFFAQDSWKVLPNLTFNLGLRWEGAMNPTAEANNAAYPLVNGFKFPWGGLTEDPKIIPNQMNQWAPRLGFAWDPKGDGKTVIRGYAGMYYASTPLILYAASVNNFREPPGDLSVQIGQGSSIIGAPGNAVAGCNPALGGNLTACDTVYEMFGIVGIDLKNYTLGNLPDLTVAQVKQIASAIVVGNGGTFNPYAGANVYFTENNYKNPKSYQAGFGFEREVAKGWTMALDGTWIKTVNMQRDRDLNMKPPSSVDPLTGRPKYTLTNNRPIPTLNQVVIRDSSAKGLYRAATFRTSYKRKWAEINAYYTLSQNMDDDYQERNATGVQFSDQYAPGLDYGLSDLDRKHAFVAQPVFFLPWGVDVSSAIRILSGAPFNTTVGNDTNGDGTSNDRPFIAVGQPYTRNSFRNLGQRFVDFRVQKGFKISETKSVKVSGEVFNILNAMNLTYASSNLQLCSSSAATCGLPQYRSVGGANSWTPRDTFMQLRNPTTGALLLNNNAGTPLEAQVSVKFIF